MKVKPIIIECFLEILKEEYGIQAEKDEIGIENGNLVYLPDENKTKEYFSHLLKRIGLNPEKSGITKVRKGELSYQGSHIPLSLIYSDRRKVSIPIQKLNYEAITKLVHRITDICRREKITLNYRLINEDGTTYSYEPFTPLGLINSAPTLERGLEELEELEREVTDSEEAEMLEIPIYDTPQGKKIDLTGVVSFQPEVSSSENIFGIEQIEEHDSLPDNIHYGDGYLVEKDF